MKRFVCTFLVIGFGTSSAFGGIVNFAPLTDVDNVPIGGTATFAVSVMGDSSLFDTIDMVIGSDDLTVIDFVYDAAFLAAFTNVVPPAPTGFFYPSDLFLSGNNPDLNDLASLSVGTLTIGTAGLAEGAYTVVVDNERDFGTSTLGNRGVADPLNGSAIVTVVPEPATLALLGVGGLVVALRRRRKA